MATIGTDLDRAAALLSEGQLVAIPTETVYGLAGNALDPDAVTSIFEVKKRPAFDPLIVHVTALDEARPFVTGIHPQAQMVAEHFWPGPLTLLMHRKAVIPDLVTAGLDRVGIRCPDHALTRKLLSRLPFPLAAPSANPFGYVSPTTPAHVQDQLGASIPYILDGGPCRVGIESTILGWEEGKPVVYRMGGISIEQLEEVIGPVLVRAHSSSRPQAPGQLQSHYAPARKVRVGNIEKMWEQYRPIKAGVLLYHDRPLSLSGAVVHSLSKDGDLHEAARNLFAMLRSFDDLDVEMIFAELVPDVGLGKAINDRLRRASA